MITVKAVGLYASYFSSGETRLGDCTMVYDDAGHFEVFDGYCHRRADHVVSVLKTLGIRSPYLHISHAHYDHDHGIYKIISDPWFTPRGLYCYDPDSLRDGFASGEIKSDAEYLRKIVNAAKAKKIPVNYVGNDDSIQHGDIRIKVYRRQPAYAGTRKDPHGWDYVNDGSLCYWFPDLRYLTTGDASMWAAYKYKLDPLVVKGGHHGNRMDADEWKKPSEMAPWLKARGCLYYWDNDYSTRLTDFLMTGREDAGKAKMTVLDIHGDIDMEFGCGKVMIFHGGRYYGTGSVPYVGSYSERWIKTTGGWWYRYRNGTWATGKAELPWSKGMDTFCFNKSGYMVTGWQYIDGKWYYFDTQSGAMRKGWIYVNKYWYFLDLKTGVMWAGWVDWKGKRCYLEPVSGRNQGHCYVSCVDTIDGKTYSFDADGYATEISGSTAVEAPTIIKNSGFHAGRNCGTRTEKVEYIVIHYTGNDGATAAENVSYFNGGNRGASAHYFVDQSGEIREYCDPTAYYSWHCGGPLESSHHPLYEICTNYNSIGIEICTRKSGGVWTFTSAAVSAAVTLTKYLMARFGVSVDHVCRHYDVTGKACPRVPGWGAVGGSAEWDKFKAALAAQPRELTDNEKFIEQIGAMARADMAKSGICAAVTVAQAILESGWGKSELAVKAKNIFGMKCNLSGNTWPGSSWDGKSAYNKSTGEYYSGTYTTVKADFRVYKDWSQSVADHGAYLAGARNGSALRYSGLVGCTDYKKAAQIIKDGDYATSPDYVTKICNIVEQYNLIRFNTDYSGPITPVPTKTTAKVPYLVKVGKGVQIYKAPGGAVVKTCPYGVYTIVEERDGYGRLKSGAGWLKLSTVTKK